ncbi:hypothetical protein E2C01_100700 [Portunus trituberculatus]|uniref:Uncharacterized protein n=1 Tax=Portunus trituberculatus TaxID=210409 RepID=A0A5B7K8R4_PORTR|nr:hypothetical protein [Portunus trituberculatus]
MGKENEKREEREGQKRRKNRGKKQRKMDREKENGRQGGGASSIYLGVCDYLPLSVPRTDGRREDYSVGVPGEATSDVL